MTYVAQPFEQFTDDLLTGLTGGMTREEHRFVKDQAKYSLAFPGAEPFYIKVSGQRNEAFVFFEEGIDFDFLSKEDAVQWKTGDNTKGRLPDDRTYFYINYYLKEGRRRLSDRGPGSVTSLLSETFGREFAVLSKQMELIYKSGFIDLAEGASLDHVTALLGITRKDARFAGGEVLFKRGTPAAGDITIPAGTLVSTDLGLNFETSGKRTLRKGQLAVTASVRAQVEGPAGRVKAGEIKNINRPILGIESVINDKETLFSTAAETDEELRRRTKGALERAGKSTVSAIKYTLIEDIPEVTEGNIQVTESVDQPGVVEIKFGIEDKDDLDLVRRIEASIFRSRAAGIRVVHNLSTRTKSESAQRAQAAQAGIPDSSTAAPGKRVTRKPKNLLPEVLKKMPEGVLQLQFQVHLGLAQANLSASQKESIMDDARKRAVDYIEKLPMGEPLIYNKLLGLIVKGEDIADADLVINTGPGTAAYRDNLAADGRKAKIDEPLKEVWVGLLEESVFFSIKVFIEPPADSGSAAQQARQIFKDGIEDIVNTIFAGTVKKLSRAGLIDKIKALINTQQLAVTLIQDQPVFIDVTFEETGRVLKNTEEVQWEDHHSPSLKELKVDEKGELDG